jgi:hypothetical protein
VVLAYSTCLGGASDDQGCDIAVKKVPGKKIQHSIAPSAFFWYFTIDIFWGK